jgi:mannosyl-3-phosphoglycerate phosphatase
MSRYVIFTDLDGTLLDHHTYSYDTARPALERLRKSAIPLIMVSSKTRLEIEVLRTEMDNQHPFIPENGGAIFIPDDYRLSVPDHAIGMSGYRVILLGLQASRIVDAFDKLASKLPVRALSQMSTNEVIKLTGLTLAQAKAARNREFGEAFILDNPKMEESVLRQEVEALGLRLTKGGRLWHLLGENDKGRAVSILSNLFRERYPNIITIGFGDSPNDAPMLAVVDQAFLLARPDGSHQTLSLPNLTKVSYPGPEGVNHTLLSLLEK